MAVIHAPASAGDAAAAGVENRLEVGPAVGREGLYRDLHGPIVPRWREPAPWAWSHLFGLLSEDPMQSRIVSSTLPEFFFAVVTRGIGGIGAGLLVSEFIEDERVRRGLGWSLLAIAAATTVPIAMRVFGPPRRVPLLAD